MAITLDNQNNKIFVNGVELSLHYRASDGNTTFAGAIKAPAYKEEVGISSTTSGTFNIDVYDNSVLLLDTAMTANWTINVRGDNIFQNLNSVLAIGESITVVCLATQGVTPYYNSVMQINSVTQTVKWQGGTAPTAGNASSVLIETMRREGYELQVGRPQVIIKDIDGVKSEPYETLSIDVPEEVASKAINLVSLRKGDLLVMEPKGDLQHLEFTIPSRGLIGLRNKILTATAGTAIINHRFSEYGAYKGDFSEDIKGAIVSSAAGKATAYAIDRLQDRGRFFIDINQEIYIGQVVGENSKDSDMGVNLIKGKQLTNMRKSGTDEAMKIAPKVDFSLEECMEYIKGDEYLEVTPESLRMRKITFRP